VVCSQFSSCIYSCAQKRQYVRLAYHTAHRQTVWDNSPYSPQMPNPLSLMYIRGHFFVNATRKLPPVTGKQESNSWWMLKKNQGNILCWKDSEGLPHFIIKLDTTTERGKHVPTVDEHSGMGSCRRNLKSVVVCNGRRLSHVLVEKIRTRVCRQIETVWWCSEGAQRRVLCYFWAEAAQRL
jgi:hypothetical protein